MSVGFTREERKIAERHGINLLRLRKIAKRVDKPEIRQSMDDIEAWIDSKQGEIMALLPVPLQNRINPLMLANLVAIAVLKWAKSEQGGAQGGGGRRDRN